MRKIIIESPYAGADQATLQRNLNYASDACRDAVQRGENPFASHLFYTQFLDDRNPEERRRGIELGYQHWDDAAAIVFYLDLGLSSGMQQALMRAFSKGLTIERRFLGMELRPKTVLPGPTVEDAIREYAGKNFKAEPVSNAVDQDERTEQSETHDAIGVGSGEHLQRT